MSRSFRKTPIIGFTTAKSEAIDKKIWHSRFRSCSKQHLNNCNDYEDFSDINFREVSNVWDMSKDGRQFLDIVNKPHYKKYLRK